MANSQNRCVFVGNIPYDATEEQLIQICEEVGPVVSFRLVLDRETGKPKGYGFCEYKDEETALSARRNLQGYHINGRQLRVDFADNEKGSDRNREQGRGGPGLSLESKPANLGDASINQPVGLSLAAAASSVMAGALGDQNRVPGGTDSLTNYLASMSNNQLYEIMSELKALAKQNNQLARQIILACPQLAKAIFQGGIMLGMVPPKMLQMSDLRQTPVMLKAHSQDGQADHMLLPPSRPPQLPPANRTQLALVQRPYDNQLVSMAPDPQTLQPTVLQQVVGQPRLPLMSQMAGPVFQQIGQASVSTSLATQGHALNQLPNLHAQSLGATFLPLKPQLQPPLPQLPRPFGSTTVVKTQDAFPGPTLQPSTQPDALLNQWGPSSSTLALGGQQADSIDAGRLAPTINSLNLKIPSGGNENNGLPATASQAFPFLKQVKLEEETEVPGLGMSNASAWTTAEPSSVIPDNYVQTHQVPTSNLTPKPEPQTFQLSGIDPALLQQVLKLKPEQLSSLSPEQRQQLIQLQQMLQ